jgi:hypothetical protein
MRGTSQQRVTSADKQRAAICLVITSVKRSPLEIVFPRQRAGSRSSKASDVLVHPENNKTSYQHLSGLDLSVEVIRSL